MRVAETKVYGFNELGPEAKEKAREWWREGGLDYDWWEFVYDDAVRVAKILGIEINTQPKNNPKASDKLAIYFSGFWSQGDGACFEGSYYYKPEWKKELLAYAPKDTELLAIGQALQDIQKQHAWQLYATVKQSGYYSHSGCTDITVLTDGQMHVDRDTHDAVTQPLREFMDWIYETLRTEYEWQTADEQVDETIRSNEYEFTSGGKIWP